MIRIATAVDVPEIARIHVEGWRAAYAAILPADFLAGLSIERRALFWCDVLAQPGNHVLVDETAVGIRGWVSWGRSRDEGGSGGAEIYAIYVDPAMWRKRVGGALLREAERGIADAAMPVVTLWVLAENQPARCFYERHGYALDGASRMITVGGSEVEEVRYAKRMMERV